MRSRVMCSVKLRRFVYMYVKTSCLVPYCSNSPAVYNILLALKFLSLHCCLQCPMSCTLTDRAIHALLNKTRRLQNVFFWALIAHYTLGYIAGAAVVQVVCFSECFSVLVLAKTDMQWHFRLSFHETIYYTHARRHVQCSITALAVCSVFFLEL